MTDNISALGFNGEYLDSTLDNYYLGNGYRAYNPSIMAFTAPDDMSPFGHGGINPYVYCSGDPINNTDPTGHFAGFLGAIIGIINMVSPLQVPTSLSVAGVEEAVMGTVVNVGVDLATDGLGAVATPVLRTVEGVARSTADDVIENVGQHAIISGIPTSHDTTYMDKLLNWVYEKPENQRDYYSWLHDTTHQSDAPGPSRIRRDKYRGGPVKDDAITARIEDEYIKAKVSKDRRQIWSDKQNIYELWAPTVAAKQAITSDIRYKSIITHLTNRRWERAGKVHNVFLQEPIESYSNESLWGERPEFAAVFKRPLS